MSSGMNPELMFSAGEVEMSIRASLDAIYGPKHPIADGILAHAMGSLALGLKPESTQPNQARTYAERLREITSPEELQELVLEAAGRLSLRVASYCKHESGTLDPHLHTDPEDVHMLTGRLMIWPQRGDGLSIDCLGLRLEGGTSSPWDPYDADSKDQIRYEHGFEVMYKRHVYDPLTREYRDIPYIHVSQELGSRGSYKSDDRVSLVDSTAHSLKPFSTEFRIVEHVMQHLDSAIDWFENVYSIAPNGVSYGKVKELGYTDAEGNLLPDWFDLMKANHHDLLWPEETASTIQLEP